MHRRPRGLGAYCAVNADAARNEHGAVCRRQGHADIHTYTCKTLTHARGPGRAHCHSCTYPNNSSVMNVCAAAGAACFPVFQTEDSCASELRPAPSTAATEVSSRPPGCSSCRWVPVLPHGSLSSGRPEGRGHLGAAQSDPQHNGEPHNDAADVTQHRVTHVVIQE